MNAPKSPQELIRQRTERRAQALSEAVASAFVDKLKYEITKHGGFIGLRHMDTIEAEFNTKAKQLSEAFAMAFEDAAREQEELRWFSIKRPAFDRLMVKRFEHLLMHRDANGNVRGAISRRVLPGFFLALHMMVGPETMEAYQGHCDEAVTRIMGGRMPIDWELVDKDTNIRDVLLDAQYTICRYFDDIPKRFNWFIHIANAHIAPPANANSFDADWELGHRSMHLLINGLLSDLRTAVKDDKAWTRLIEGHPGADRQHIEAILERLA
jgi:hypothetical protein